MLSHARMRNERGNSLEQHASIEADGCKQIVDAFGRAQRKRMRTTIAQRLDQAFCTRRRRGASIARNIIDVRAALNERASEQRTAALSAENQHAFSIHVPQLRQSA